MARCLILAVLAAFLFGCDSTPGVESKPPPPGGPPKQERHPPGLKGEDLDRYK